jgi:hypothetical protein
MFARIEEATELDHPTTRNKALTKLRSEVQTTFPYGKDREDLLATIDRSLGYNEAELGFNQMYW